MFNALPLRGILYIIRSNRLYNLQIRHFHTYKKIQGPNIMVGLVLNMSNKKRKILSAALTIFSRTLRICHHTHIRHLSSGYT
jgi:hypothetical protein